MKRSKLACHGAVKAPAAPVARNGRRLGTQGTRAGSIVEQRTNSPSLIGVRRELPDPDLLPQHIDAPGSLATAQTLLERARIMHFIGQHFETRCLVHRHRLHAVGLSGHILALLSPRTPLVSSHFSRVLGVRPMESVCICKPCNTRKKGQANDDTSQRFRHNFRQLNPPAELHLTAGDLRTAHRRIHASAPAGAAAPNSPAKFATPASIGCGDSRKNLSFCNILQNCGPRRP